MLLLVWLLIMAFFACFKPSFVDALQQYKTLCFLSQLLLTFLHAITEFQVTVAHSLPAGIGSIQNSSSNNSITLIYGVPSDEGPGLLAVLFYYSAAHEKNSFLSAHPQNKISID